MSPIAITFLILSIVLVWGGLVVSIIALVRSSRRTSASTDPSDTPRPDRI